MGEVIQDAAQYPRELVRTITLKDGFSARIRPIRPDDEPRLVDLYERLSRHTAYQRFFTVLRRLPADWYHFFANVDYVRRLALVAERETVAGVQLIGVGRYEPAEEPDTACHRCNLRDATSSVHTCVASASRMKRASVDQSSRFQSFFQSAVDDEMRSGARL